MAILGAISCTTGVGNTGIQLCAFDPKFIQGAILAPKGYQLPVANLSTALSALLYNTSKTGRGYPVYDFEKVTDSSDKLVLQSMATGAKHPVREGYTDLMYQYVAGGLSLLKNLRLFNGSNWDFYLIDNDPLGQKIMGITGKTAGNLAPFPSDGGFFWAHPWTPNNGTEIAGYNLQFSTKQIYTNDLINFVSFAGDLPTAFPGLTDAILQANAVASVVAKHFYINLLNPLGVDLGAIYATALGAGVGSAALWNGAAAATPTLPYTITSSTWVPSTNPALPGYFDILVAATNYATPPAASLMNLGVPSALVTAGVDVESTGALSIPSV